MGAKLLLLLSLLFAPLAVQATPTIQHWTLENGTRVLFVESHELPMVQVKLVFDAGSARDDRGRGGLALMTNHLLQEGAGGHNADQIAARLEGMGAELSTSVDRDMASVGLRSLVDPALLRPALDLFTEVVLTPTFPSDSLERERQRLLVGLSRQEQSPGDIANKTFFKLLYGGHPYSHESSGEAVSVKAIARKDLAVFHRRYYVGANAVLVLVGDLKPRQARKIAKQVGGRLPAGKPAPPLPPVADLEQARVEQISFPSSQTHILMGQPGMTRKDPDYFALYLGNYILGGGGLVSRLSQEVREKHGLSYSVYSYFWPLRERGPFTLGLQTKNSRRTQALALLRQILKKYVQEGPSPEELAAAKKHLTGGFPLRIDNSKKIAGYLAVIGFYGLPLSYLDDFNMRIEAVTLEQIRDAYRRRVQPERMVTVIVGGTE